MKLRRGLPVPRNGSGNVMGEIDNDEVTQSRAPRSALCASLAHGEPTRHCESISVRVIHNGQNRMLAQEEVMRWAMCDEQRELIEHGRRERLTAITVGMVIFER